MNNGKKLPKAARFLKKRKRIKLWHRLLLIAGSVVVFMTTYMLILPAITAEIGTLAIYDESVSSGAAVIEEVTEDESTYEETTEENTSPKGSGGTLADGTVINVTMDKVEDEKEVKGNSLFKALLAAATLTDGATITTSGKGENGKYVCTYDPDTGEFEAGLNIHFTIPQDALKDYSGDLVSKNDGTKSYTIELPEEIIIPDSLLYDKDGSTTSVYDGQMTGGTSTAFKYYFEPVRDADGNVTNYQVVMVFLDSYLKTLEHDGIKEDINGHVEFDTHISVDSYTEDGKIVINKPGYGFEIEINKDEIQFNDNETVNRDVMVTKKGSYNSSDNTITYMVMVLSKKGTGETIEIEDSFNKSDFISSLGGELVSVEYKTGVVGVCKASYGTLISEAHTEYSEIKTISDTVGGEAYYTYDGNGKLTMILPGLEGASGEYPTESWDTNIYENTNAHVIIYTYSISPEAGKSYSTNNTAIAKIHDDVADKDIQGSAEATVTVSGKKLITKTGSFDSYNSKIKWTITVGDGEDTLNGYTLYDEIFAELTEEEIKNAIKDENGTLASEDYYEIIKDGAGNTIKGIKFKEGAGNKYVVEYTTNVTKEWKSQKVENIADLVPDDNSGTSEGRYTVTVPGDSDCFKKAFDSAMPNEDSTYTLNWTTSFKIPESGIPAGIMFTDYVEGTGHYITGEQAKDIISSLNSSWNNNITNIQFYTGDNRWNMQDNLWVNAADISDTGKYYQFRFTTSKEIVQTSKKDENDEKVSYNNDEIRYTYSTTANVSDVVDSREYYNSVVDSQAGTTKTDKWTYGKKVVKYGFDNSGNITANNSSVTTTDGTVTWVVKVAFDSSIDSYKIKDTLPAGVTLSELYIAKDNNYNYEEVSIDEGSTSLFNGALNVEYSSEGDSTTGQDITLNAVVSNQTVSSIYIKYVCKIDNTGATDSTGETPDGKTNKTFNLTNAVNVTVDGEKSYGSDNQTSDVTWTEGSSSGDTIKKDAQFDENNNKVQYSLDINPNGTIYTVDGEEFSDLQLEDILSYYSFPDKGFLRDASLILNSVKLYYAETNEDGSGKTDSNGKLINSNIELSPEDYKWSCREKVDGGYGTDRVTKYIDLTIPNGVPIIFKYEYVVKIIKEGESADWDTKADVENKAIVSINGIEIETATSEKIENKVEESGTSGSADSGASYTIYKVDKDNFALTLSGATFDLYVYDKEAGEFVYEGSCTTSGGSTGIVGIPNREINSETGEQGDISSYDIILSDKMRHRIPVNTICYFVESVAPDGYKLDTTKRYFYFGSSSATVVQACEGYSNMESPTADNIIISHTEYISNEHSPDYYAEKTNLAVVKKWVDADGNDITKSKSDGSIKFKLMQVFTPVEGSGEIGGDTPSENKKNLTVNIVDQNNSAFLSNDANSTAYNSKIPQSCKEGTVITIRLKHNYGANIVEWNGQPPAINVNGELLEPTIEKGDYDGNPWYYVYTFTVNEDTVVSGTTNWKAGGVILDNFVVEGNDVEETTENIEGFTEVTTAEAVDTVIHEHNFSDMDNNILSDDKKTSTIIDSYFNISGNLSDDHGEATYKINGEATTLTRCLKMEKDTSITFTASEKGLLTLVFNTNGNGNESTMITNGCKIDGTVYSATNNVLVKEIEAGTHTITKQDTCYLFYMSFEDGAVLADSNIYAHNFNDGMQSLFYQIDSKGSTATNKGTVIYNDMTISTCFKMNSKANISFDAPYEGTINLVLTNPNNSPAVGVKIDGVDHYATATGEYDSKGNEIYLLTARVSKGEHIMTRINSTESMLYYMEYTPDNYGDENLSSTVPNNPNAIEYGTYIISAQDTWAKTFTNLPWQVLNDNGETIGYYSYYVVEVDNDGYITQYKNNVANGVSSGTIGIQNQDKDNSTQLEVIKNWLSNDGIPENDKHSEDEVVFNLYGAINLYDGKTLDTTKTEAHSFTTYNSDFYTITTNYGNDGVIHGPYIVNSYGTAKYNNKTYTSCLKMESKSSIKYTAPANGTLTLVFSNKFPDGFGGLGFKLTHGGNTNAYSYDVSTGETTGNSCTVSYSDEAVIFNVTLDEAGDYEITTNKQCYLFYMDYTYKLSDAKDGVLIGSYTISASDIESENWRKTISSLPLYIKGDNNEVIGEYSYYVVETSPGSGYDTTVEYTQSGDIPSDLVIQKDTITAGTITITNKTNPADVVLPETGGRGTKFYTIGGALLLCCAVCLLYIRKINEREVN